MSDSIHIKDIALNMHIGITEKERQTKQKILVNIELLGSLQHVSTSDDIEKGIDYEKVLRTVQATQEEGCKTVEHCAEKIATEVLAAYKPKDGITVSVQKFPLPDIHSVIITIHRP